MLASMCSDIWLGDGIFSLAASSDQPMKDTEPHQRQPTEFLAMQQEYDCRFTERLYNDEKGEADRS
jgi:hypothetical protein